MRPSWDSESDAETVDAHLEPGGEQEGRQAGRQADTRGAKVVVFFVEEGA